MSKNNKGIFFVLGLLAILVFIQFISFGQLSAVNLGKFHQFIIIYSAIIFETIPFVLIGVVAASLLEMYISEKAMQRIIPKSPIRGVLLASLLGLAIPICECGIIPVVRKLFKKGLPMYIGMTMVMAVPIINPVVILSTYFAFVGFPNFVIYRVVFGFIVAVTVGLTLSRIKQPDLKDNDLGAFCDLTINDVREKSRLGQLLHFSTYELFLMGKFLLFGAGVSALIQVMTPRAYLELIGQNQITAILIMMALTYGLSLCSEADAFIARGFLLSFTPHSVLSFLVLGPMIDIKNTLMLLAVFKKKFVVKFISLLFIIVFALVYLSRYFITLT